MKNKTLIILILCALCVACKKEKKNAAPTVSITSPANGASSTYGYTTITADASDSDGSISKVEFYNGNTLLGQDTEAPYSISTSLSYSVHTLTAKAYDNASGTSTSTSVEYTVYVSMPPIGVLMKTK